MTKSWMVVSIIVIVLLSGMLMAMLAGNGVFDHKPKWCATGVTDQFYDCSGKR